MIKELTSFISNFHEKENISKNTLKLAIKYISYIHAGKHTHINAHIYIHKNTLEHANINENTCKESLY